MSAGPPAHHGFGRLGSLGRLFREIPGVVLRPVRDAEDQDDAGDRGQHDGEGPTDFRSAVHRQLGVPLGPGPVDGPSLAVV